MNLNRLLPMAETSTLFYLVDDFNLPSDMLLSSSPEVVLKEEYMLAFLDILEIDPGEALVNRTLKLIENME